MDAPTEGRGGGFICGVHDAKARAQDRGGGVSGSRNKIRQKTARTPCRPRSTAWIWGVRGVHAKKSSNQIRQMNIFFGCTPARPFPSTTILMYGRNLSSQNTGYRLHFYHISAFYSRKREKSIVASSVE